MTFNFEDFKDFAKWLRVQAEAARKQATAEKNHVRCSYHNGRAFVMEDTANCIEDGTYRLHSEIKEIP